MFFLLRKYSHRSSSLSVDASYTCSIFDMLAFSNNSIDNSRLFFYASLNYGDSSWLSDLAGDRIW